MRGKIKRIKNRNELYEKINNIRDKTNKIKPKRKNQTKYVNEFEKFMINYT